MVINPTRLTIDEPVDSIIASGDSLLTYYQNIDDEIHSLCWINGVTPSNIPVDSSGYVTSIPLAMYATYYGIYRINTGYTRQEGDVYDRHAREYYALAQNAKGYITKDTILGGDLSKLVNPQNIISQGFMAV